MPPEEDVVALVVHGDNLAAFEVRAWGPEGFEEVSGEEAEGGAEVV